MGHFTDTETKQMFIKLPEEKRRMIATELTAKGYNVNKDFIPMMTTYLNCIEVAVEHALKVWEILMPTCINYIEQLTINEQALGLQPTIEIDKRWLKDESRKASQKVKELQEE